MGVGHEAYEDLTATFAGATMKQHTKKSLVGRYQLDECPCCKRQRVTDRMDTLPPCRDPTSEKTRLTVEAMGMTHLFPIYDDLVDSQYGLPRCENTTTEFVMRGLRIKESTGIEKILSVDRGLTIFVLLKMAADHHRLVTGLRRHIALGTYMDKEAIIQVLYHYIIDSRAFERLVGTHITWPATSHLHTYIYYQPLLSHKHVTCIMNRYTEEAFVLQWSKPESTGEICPFHLLVTSHVVTPESRPKTNKTLRSCGQLHGHIYTTVYLKS